MMQQGRAMAREATSCGPRFGGEWPCETAFCSGTAQCPISRQRDVESQWRFWSWTVTWRSCSDVPAADAL